MLKILGYPDRYSVVPGEDIAFMVSSEDGSDYDASLVRVICGDANPEGPGLQFDAIASAIDGTYAGGKQRTDAGSFMTADVPQLDRPTSFTLFATVWPTLLKRHDQVLFSKWDAVSAAGFKLKLVEGGRLAFLSSDGKTEQTVRLDVTMLERQWYRVHCAVDLDAQSVTLTQTPVHDYAGIEDGSALRADLSVLPGAFHGPVMIAGCPVGEGVVAEHFDGKIDGPSILRGAHAATTHMGLLATPISGGLRADLLAGWDFSIGIDGIETTDISDHGNHGTLHNLPARGMKGWNWTGKHHRWTEHPEHYGAIHFHHDDLYDAAWEESFTLTIPHDLMSGNYAVRVRNGENTVEETRDYYIPFFICSPRRAKGVSGSRDRIAFLAPTAAYMAYANHAEHITAPEAERTIGRLLQFGHADVYMHGHPEIGGSLYDVHADGSGVCYSSRLRPVLNFTSQYHSWLGGHGSALWQYNADTHLLSWLEAKRFDYDVVTDEDLHAEGVDLLADYRVVLTGTHPEYYSTDMWNALKAWIDQGGRLMYLGANGFYWRIAFHRDLPGVIEVRRAEDGIRTWAAEPGEYYHSFTGEFGGLYRRIGRAPNVMCGLGFVAQGFDRCSYYRRAPDADDPRAAFIFEGVSDEILGDFGLIGDGAAGLELDCITTELGSPPDTLRLATSENHTQQVMLVNEEFGVVPMNLGGDQNDKVRADLAFYETPSGGAVFSVGSIAWCGALPVNGFDNNISAITENVLRRFADAEPFATR
ncbi:MAG: N,N-dimethylformamidase [Hyphomicrobiales bacterium]|nr:N,N-dimethylformamidase [Hyphomicrobiales bacterium]